MIGFHYDKRAWHRLKLHQQSQQVLQVEIYRSNQDWQ